MIGLEEAKRRYPLLRTDDLVGAVWIPSDGKGNPADITQALATGARAGGARVLEQVRVTGVTLRDGAVAGVETSEGAIATEVVVNCAGIWARELGRMSGVTVPLHACEHMYMVTRAHRRRRARTCPSCAIPTATSTSRKRWAGSSWAASTPGPSRGAWTASRRTSPSVPCRRTGTSSRS